jgi:hypothetical protein
MERFPRGSIPPSAFAAVATLAPTAVARPPNVAPGTDDRASVAVETDDCSSVAVETDDCSSVATQTDGSSSVAMQTAASPPVARATRECEQVSDPTKQCDLSTTCPNCGAQMQPEHAHYRCGACGYRDSCCF